MPNDKIIYSNLFLFVTPLASIERFLSKVDSEIAQIVVP